MLQTEMKNFILNFKLLFKIIFWLLLLSLKSVVWRRCRWRGESHRAPKTHAKICLLCQDISSRDVNVKVKGWQGPCCCNIAQKLRNVHFWDISKMPAHTWSSAWACANEVEGLEEYIEIMEQLYRFSNACVYFRRNTVSRN